VLGVAWRVLDGRGLMLPFVSAGVSGCQYRSSSSYCWKHSAWKEPVNWNAAACGDTGQRIAAVEQEPAKLNCWW
jgi:hypothetical protein